MPSLGSYSYVYGPLLAAGMLGLLVLLLRWAFGHGGSLVSRRPRQGRPDEYGVLEAVGAPGTVIEAEIQKRTLEDSGIRATVALTNDGPRVMVFPEDARTARALLRPGAGPGQVRG